MRRTVKEEQQGLLGGRVGEGSHFADEEGLELGDFEDSTPRNSVSLSPLQRRSHLSRALRHLHLPRSCLHPHRRSRTLIIVFVTSICLLLACGLFFPSYSNPPPQYNALRKRVNRAPGEAGSANVNNEKIFIAAALYDREGKLVSGDWGRSVLGLIDVLGPENVHLSIYENDADEKSKAALDKFKPKVSCNSTIFVEDLDVSQIAHVSGVGGERKLKRIAFLAEVRNRALKPLEDAASPASQTRFDRLLYINDVVFDPVDAANLLFSTNVDAKTGRTQYRAACATDFINPVKFYDTFATRDLEGYDMGVIFYPWFTGAGEGLSRRDVLAQKDAVRVKSCWGGMVAFEARWFQSSLPTDDDQSKEKHPPLRFRAVNDTYWDASECCLVHADLTELASEELAEGETGIFLNPYVRVAYSKASLRWLSFSRRFEWLYSPVQSFINWIARRPSFNPRRLEQPDDEVVDRVWTWDPPPNEMQGSFQEVTRVAEPGSFCGQKGLWYMDEKPVNGKRKWGIELPPAG